MDRPSAVFTSSAMDLQACTRCASMNTWPLLLPPIGTKRCMHGPADCPAGRPGPRSCPRASPRSLPINGRWSRRPCTAGRCAPMTQGKALTTWCYEREIREIHPSIKERLRNQWRPAFVSFPACTLHLSLSASSGPAALGSLGMCSVPPASSKISKILITSNH